MKPKKVRVEFESVEKHWVWRLGKVCLMRLKMVVSE